MEMRLYLGRCANIKISDMRNVYLLTLFLLTPFISGASIVYTDLNPDKSGILDPNLQTASNIASIDFNKDANEDCNFEWTDLTLSGTTWYCNITLSGSNEAVLDGVSTGAGGARYLKAITSGTTIDGSGNWGSSNPEPLLSDNAMPNFQGKGDVYVGVKFNIGVDIHYGWILVSFSNLKELTVKEFAYESTPNTGIKAGEKSTPPVLVTSITVDGQGGKSTITTSGGSLQMEASVLPANATNKTVTWSVTDGTGSATISVSGLLKAKTNGTVTVKATANDMSGMSGTKVITISNQTVLVNNITVMGMGGATTITTASGTLQMQAAVLPANASNNSITWSVTEITGKASIDAMGLLTAIEDGVVTVVATANDGSGVTGSTDITISNQTASVFTQTGSQKINVYPNPTNQFLEISSEIHQDRVHGEICNVQGQVLLQFDNQRIDVSNLAPGIYYLNLVDGNAIQYSTKFVKQ